MTDPNTALVLAIGGLLAALIDYAVERSPSPHNSIVGAFVAAWKAWRARGAALLLAGLLGGCAPAWSVAGGLADASMIALGRYQAWTASERREITRKAAPQCEAAPGCYDAALAPFEAAQKPALACLAAVQSSVEVAALAAERKDKGLAKVAIPILVKSAGCADEIRTAKGWR